MSFLDRLRGNKPAARLPRKAKVAQRRRRNGTGSDIGYWHANTFYLLDGSATDTYDYVGGQGELLDTREARVELAQAGYEDSSNYTSPTASPSYSSDSPPPFPGGTSTGSSYSSNDSYSSGGSSDSGYSSGGGSSSGYNSGGSSSSSSGDSSYSSPSSSDY